MSAPLISRTGTTTEIDGGMGRPATLAGGVLAVPKLGLTKRSRTEEFELASLRYAGVTSRRVVTNGRHARVYAKWTIRLWRQRDDAVELRLLETTTAIGEAEGMVGSLRGTDDAVLQTDIGKVAALIDNEIAAALGTPPLPTAGAISGYLPEDALFVWIPRLGVAFADGPFRPAASHP